jgi:hypothetical protein
VCWVRLLPTAPRGEALLRRAGGRAPDHPAQRLGGARLPQATIVSGFAADAATLT